MDESKLSDLLLEKQRSRPDPFIVQPVSEHTYTAILLHGLGSNGDKLGTELLQSGITSHGATLTSSFPVMRLISRTAKKRRSSALNRADLN